MTAADIAKREVLVPMGGQRCCHEGCGRPAQFWIGPADSNGIDDYTEMCADHQPDYTGVNDIVVEFDDRGYPSGPAAEVTP